MSVLTQVPIPVRFLFFLLGPLEADLDYHETGRSISTLLSKEVSIIMLCLKYFGQNQLNYKFWGYNSLEPYSLMALILLTLFFKAFNTFFYLVVSFLLVYICLGSIFIGFKVDTSITKRHPTFLLRDCSLDFLSHTKKRFTLSYYEVNYFIM